MSARDEQGAGIRLLGHPVIIHGFELLVAFETWRQHAVQTGLEPATFALTGRRALQLLYRTLLLATSAPDGTRTRTGLCLRQLPLPLGHQRLGLVLPADHTAWA